FANDNRVCVSAGNQGHRIASAGSPNRLGIDRRSTVFADQAIWSFEETDWAADLARVKDRYHLAIGLLVKQEADISSVLMRHEAVKVAVGNLRQGNADRSIHKRHRSGRRQRTDALGVNEFRSDKHDEQKRCGIDGKHPQALATSTPQSFPAFGATLR